MKRYFALLFCISSLNAGAQTVINLDKDNNAAAAAVNLQLMNGLPFGGFKFVRLTEGSPYFREEYLPGVIYLDKGERCRGNIKLDLFDNELLYRDAAGNEFVAAMPAMKKIEIQSGDTVFVFHHSSQLPATHLPLKANWLLQLTAEDSVQLYQYFKKELVETRQYNAAAYDQKIQTSPVFVIVYKGKAVAFQKIKEAPALFPEYKTELEAWLKTADDKKQAADKKAFHLVLFLNGLMMDQKGQK